MVDKDLTTALLAVQLQADVLLLLTDVANVQRDYGTPSAGHRPDDRRGPPRAQLRCRIDGPQGRSGLSLCRTDRRDCRRWKAGRRRPLLAARREPSSTRIAGRAALSAAPCDPPGEVEHSDVRGPTHSESPACRLGVTARPLRSSTAMGASLRSRDQSHVEVVVAWEWPTSLAWSAPFPSDFDPDMSPSRCSTI